MKSKAPLLYISLCTFRTQKNENGNVFMPKNEIVQQIPFRGNNYYYIYNYIYSPLQLNKDL